MGLSYIPANLSLIKSNGCVASVDTTPPLSPATRCSYWTPEKKESGTVLDGVSRTSSAIVSIDRERSLALLLNSVRLGLKQVPPTHFGHAHYLPAKQLIWRQNGSLVTPLGPGQLRAFQIALGEKLKLLSKYGPYQSRLRGCQKR